jgi:hypothetical protein
MCNRRSHDNRGRSKPSGRTVGARGGGASSKWGIEILVLLAVGMYEVMTDQDVT